MEISLFQLVQIHSSKCITSWQLLQLRQSLFFLNSCSFFCLQLSILFLKSLFLSHMLCNIKNWFLCFWLRCIIHQFIISFWFRLLISRSSYFLSFCYFCILLLVLCNSFCNTFLNGILNGLLNGFGGGFLSQFSFLLF